MKSFLIWARTKLSKPVAMAFLVAAELVFLHAIWTASVTVKTTMIILFGIGTAILLRKISQQRS